MTETCDRCDERVSPLYLSKDLSAPSVEIVGVPFYCERCMKETGQLITNVVRIRTVKQEY